MKSGIYFFSLINIHRRTAKLIEISFQQKQPATAKTALNAL